jgi:class 3 adenylate cyclase
VRTPATRHNQGLLRALVAVAYAATGWLALSKMSFTPTSIALLLSIGIGLVAVASTEAATAAFVVAATVPIFAADALLGIVFLVVGFAMTQYLGGDEVPVFVFVAAAFACALLGPVWAVPVLAGYVLGGSRGALASAVACIALEVAAIAVGRPGFGAVLVGTSKPVISFADNPEKLLALSWFLPQLKAISASSATAFWNAATGANVAVALVLQPAAWAAAAFVSGRLRRPAGDKQQLIMGFVAAAGGVAVATGASIASLTAANLSPAYSQLTVTAVSSLLVAGAGTIVWDRVFKVLPKPERPQMQQAGPRNMVQDDADVDELLRLIATAEDKIATQHTSESVVMITDMKSFTRMTEEEGSFVTAKAIQRHRDLLLPVIESHGGKGKSTGGDGLIASFASATDALCAAVDMQQVLAKHNAEHVRERDISIRVGIASGEVVLDKGGRPFIGNAVNLSARVMSLGDGGQVLATRDIASSAKTETLDLVSHGEFELKNIAHPVEVIEVLWREGQSPCDPRTLGVPQLAAAEQPEG